MKKSKNFVLFMLAIIAIVSCFSIPASAAGNYYDSSYDTGDHSIADTDTFYHTFPSPLAYGCSKMTGDKNDTEPSETTEKVSEVLQSWQKSGIM